jgi:hypothetical protein
MTDHIWILHAGGGGAHWLKHTIACLESGTFDIIPMEVADKFDNASLLSSNVTTSHCLDDVESNPHYIFSTKYMFNIFIAGHVKNPHVIEGMPLQETFTRYTNDASYQMSSENIYNPIDLDHDWLHNDPQRFIDVFFKILDIHKFVYDKNYDFMYSSIKNYIITNPSPIDYYDNYNSLMWLGWCHAVILNNGLSSVGSIIECSTISEIVSTLIPHRDICLSEIKKFIIPGTI